MKTERKKNFKKLIINQEIIFLNKKKITISQCKLAMLLVATTLNIKVMEIR